MELTLTLVMQVAILTGPPLIALAVAVQTVTLRRALRHADRERMDVLQSDIAAWAEVTIGRGRPSAIVRHFAREAEEFAQAPSPEGAAHCAILLLRYASLRRCSLYEAVQKRMAANRARRWLAPDTTGVVEHVRTAGG